MNKKEENITNRMRYLVDTLNKAAKVYYQTGEELMPNFEYDKLERELEALEQETGIMLSDSPTIRTGISVDDAEGLTDSRLAKVTHEYPARSLAKTKDESLFPKVFSVRDNMAVLMWKEDGGTIVATYDDGKLVSLATRGNGIIGQDITHNAKYIHGLPMALPFKSHFVVRGEALMSYSEFERVNSSLPEDVEHYKNPRNLANSTINLTAEKEMEHREIWFHCKFLRSVWILYHV